METLEVKFLKAKILGQVPKWPKGTDCKSVAPVLQRFESFPAHHFNFAVPDANWKLPGAYLDYAGVRL